MIVFDAYHPHDLPNVFSLSYFIGSGDDDGSFEQHIEKSKPEEVVSFIYTSGTTGHPKAGVISNRNVISMIQHLPDLLDIYPHDMTVAYLPLAHIAERLLGHFLKLVEGHQTAFAESIEDMPDNVRQVGPTIMFGTPRVYEKYYARIATGVADATSLQKKIYNWAVNIGKRRAKRLADNNNSSISLGLQIQSVLARLLICWKIRKML